MLDDITARPYFLRAFYDWCVDMKRTPYILAHWNLQKNPKVPPYLSVDGKIIFNISPLAVRCLRMEKSGIFFTARFLGQTVEVAVPLQEVMAIYAQETGKGLSFPSVAALAGELPDEEEEASAVKEKAPVGRGVVKVAKMTSGKKRPSKPAKKASVKNSPPPDLKVI